MITGITGNGTPAAWRWLGRSVGAVIVSLALSAPASSVTLEQDQDPGPGTSSSPPGPDFLVRGAAQRAQQARSLADLDGNGLSDGLEAILAGLSRKEQIDVVVTFSGPGNAASAQGAVGPFTVKHEYHLIDGFAATMSAGQARALANVSGVFRVEEDFQVHLAMEWARQDFGAEAVWTDPVPYTGAGVKVCVVDTGIHRPQEQFVSQYDGDGNPVATRIAAFHDFVGDYEGTVHAEPYDDFIVGHGTHVAGIIAGDGVEGPNISAPLLVGDPVNAPRARGVAPDALLYVAKAIDFTGSSADSVIIQGIEWCVDQGVDVINLSLGAPGSTRGKDSLSRAARNAIKAGIVVVAAAGNAGDFQKSIVSPAAADPVIAVGAAAEWSSDPTGCPPEYIFDPSICWDSDGFYPAPFTSRGPTDDGRIKPDLMAPGVTILSATNDDWAYLDPDWGVIFLGSNGCGISCYRALSGTSMATPYVSGTVALMLQANPDLAPAEVFQILIDTAEHRGLGSGKNNLYGHGVVDTFAAVKEAEALATQTVASYVPTAFPSHLSGSEIVPDTGSIFFPIDVTDTSLPLAITVTIEGEPFCGLSIFNICLAYAWDPDIDAFLREGGEVGPIVFTSGCPGIGDCRVGHQETIYLPPPLASATYTLELALWDGDPKYGGGGSFPVTFDISNGTTALPLTAMAGPDQEVTDDDGDGVADVPLDGSGSFGQITSYEWSNGVVLATSETETVSLPVGDHTITLTVSDGIDLSTDEVFVKVKAAKGGGGGGPSGDKCFRNKEPLCP